MKESQARKRSSLYRSRKIIAAAMELFCDQGIEQTSVEEVAERAGVGAATIYRYYETKSGLAVEAGVAYWKKIEQEYLNVDDAAGYADMTGKEQLQYILDALVRIFEHETAFLKYLQEFDVFLFQNRVDKEKLTEYEACIMNLKPRVTDALEKGLNDGTLSFDWTPEEVCYSLAHTSFGLMKRLAWNGTMLNLDRKVSLLLQVQIALRLMLDGLSVHREKLEDRRGQNV